MGLDNTIYALSNINAILGSTVGYINDKQNGVPTGYALSNFGNNIFNGVFRNAVSRDIRQTTGSYLGYAVNSAAGYGNPVSNYNGTVGTLNAALLTSPFACCSFNPYMMASSIYSCNPFNYGFFGSGMFGGYNSYGLGGASFFSPMGFYC